MPPPPDGSTKRTATSWRAGVNSIFRGLALVLVLSRAFSVLSLASSSAMTLSSGVEYLMDLPTQTTQTTLLSNPYAPGPPDRDFVPSTDGFGGCLLIKEDNHRLDEWLAYHLVVLPLRYLIVAIDSMSGQSPLPILEKWNGTFGLFIETWSDGDFIPNGGDVRGREKLCNQWHKLNLMKNYLGRQQFFMKGCALQMERTNMTWVSFVDSDEFWLLNHIEDDETESIGGALAESNAPEIRKRLPASLGDGGITIYDFLNKEREEHQFPACFVAPRLLFSAVDSTPEERLRSNHTDLGFDDVTRFNTLRFFRHAGRRHSEAIMLNRDGKPVMDVSRISGLEGRAFRNPHYPFPGAICDTVNRKEHINNHGKHHFRSVLRVNHYLGSQEEYFARHDHRRSNESFLQKAKVKIGTSYTILPWLRLFVEKVGSVARAKELLGDAGIIVSFEPVDLCRDNRANVTAPLAPFFFPSSRGGQWAH